MTKRYEVVDQFMDAEDAGALLYNPAKTGLTFRETRVYEFEIEGDQTALDEFVSRTLIDAVSQEKHSITESSTALDGYLFALDYGMKRGVLDLEKEAILTHYATKSDRGFTLNSLAITHRIYIFGDSGTPDAFVKDICNPAIHRWNILSTH